MSEFYNNSIFWIETHKIKPNPFQPRHDFNEDALADLADSIKQYGVLQPLVVTRKEIEKEDGGLVAEYELIAGERRLRASKIAGLTQIPVIIRSGEQDDQEKLEIAIIENLQREDLNPVDRARAFHRLVEEFGFKHIEVAKKVGKSREYVSNTLRLLSLPDDILQAIATRRITEGHARPIMMLADRPEEQKTLFREITLKRLTVRDAEGIARRIAYDRVRKKDRSFDPDIIEMEERLSEELGTRVYIDQKEVGGKITIDFFSEDDLRNLLFAIQPKHESGNNAEDLAGSTGEPVESESAEPATEEVSEPEQPEQESEDSDNELYFIKNFSV